MAYSGKFPRDPKERYRHLWMRDYLGDCLRVGLLMTRYDAERELQAAQDADVIIANAWVACVQDDTAE